MAAVLALITKLEPKALERVAVATTRWIVEDETSDIEGLVRDATGGGASPYYTPTSAWRAQGLRGCRPTRRDMLRRVWGPAAH